MGGGGGKGGGSSSQVVGYMYYLGMHMVFCHGPVDFVGPLYAGERFFHAGVGSPTSVYVNKENLFGGKKKEGGIKGQVDFLFGGPTQPQNGYLVSKLGLNVPAYRGVVSLVANKCYVCANSPYPKAWAARITRIPGQDWRPSTAAINTFSANGAHIIREAIMNTDWGMGYPSSAIDDDSFSAAATTLHAEGLGLSMLLSGQGSVEEFMQQVLRHINGVVYTDRVTGKFVLKLTRDDYVVGDLPIFDTSNIKELSSFQRPTYGEMINEVIIVYRPRGAFTDAALTFQDLASVQAQGGVISQTMQYPGIDSSANASIVGVRELKQNSTPLAKVRFLANRDAWNLNPGDPFVFKWEPKGISQIVLRAMSLNYGGVVNGMIEVNAVEDIFGVPASAYTEPQDSIWTDPVGDPVPTPGSRLEEVPAWDLIMNLSRADLDYLEPTDCFLHYLAREPSVASPGYGIWTDPADTGDFARTAYGVYPPTALLAQDLDETQEAGVLVSSLTWIAELLEMGYYAYIGDEVVRVDDVDIDAGTIDIGRGCLDSAPRRHASGTRVWFAEDKGGVDETSYAPAEELNARATPVTGKDELDVASASTEVITFTGRQFKPYPAGRYAFNGSYYPATIIGALALTWVHRDRTLQTARPIVDHFDGTIGPEPGSTYTAKMYGERDLVTTPLRTDATLSASPRTWTEELVDSALWVHAPVDTHSFLLPLDTNERVEGPDQTVGLASNVTNVAFDGEYAAFAGDGYMDVEDIDLGETVSVAFGLKGGSALITNSQKTVAQKASSAGANILSVELFGAYLRVYIGPSGYYTGSMAYFGGSLDSDHVFLVTVEKDQPTPGHSRVTVYTDGVQQAQASVSATIGSMAGKPWSVGAGWSGTSTRDNFLTASIHRLSFFKGLLAPTGIWPEQRLNDTVRATLTTVRDGEDSRMDCDHTAERAGFGYRYGEYYGGV
jgi:hypothetical protein